MDVKTHVKSIAIKKNWPKTVYLLYYYNLCKLDASYHIFINISNHKILKFKHLMDLFTYAKRIEYTLFFHIWTLPGERGLYRYEWVIDFEKEIIKNSLPLTGWPTSWQGAQSERSCRRECTSMEGEAYLARMASRMMSLLLSSRSQGSLRLVSMWAWARKNGW